MALPHEAILGINISSALVDALLYHSWPPATRDEEMHPLVLRKSWSLKLPYVEKLQSREFFVFCSFYYTFNVNASKLETIYLSAGFVIKQIQYEL